MSIHLIFNRERLSYSTFDTVSGIVAVRLLAPTTVSAISVKLEGEATSTLGPVTGDKKKDKKNTEAEVHKVLYYVQTVFPSPQVLRHAVPGTTWTISAGRYEFPFSFKIPYESDCIRNTRGHPNNLGDLLLDNNRDMYNNVHIRSQLPPSLEGPVNMANIVYFVKATLVRPQFYKENYRALTRLTFIPSEPQRPAMSKEETYARRQYTFGTALKRSQSFLPRLLQKSEPAIDFAGDQPSFCVDARLPNPAILTCNRPVPLRIVFKKLNDSNAPLYLTSLDIEIIGYTHIRARHLRRTETTTWPVRSGGNLDRLLARGDVTAGTEWELDSMYWNQIPLPQSIAPTFTTCNISRTYELQIRLSFTNGPLGAKGTQMATLPLKLQCDIYSGIVPPPHVIEPGLTPIPPQPIPIPPVVPPPGPPPQPPRPAVPPSIPDPEAGDDAPPPTYEDAVADSLRQAGEAQGVQPTNRENEQPARSPLMRKPVPPPVTTNYPSPAAGPSSAPPSSERSTPRPIYSPQAHSVASPPPGPPPGNTGRSMTMPTGGSATHQPSLLDDSPEIRPQAMTPQPTANNPFAEYLSEGPQQSRSISQPNRSSAQSSLLDTSPVYRSPTVHSSAGGRNSPRTNNPFAEYLDQETNQPAQNGYPFARDVSAQIDDDHKLAEQLQQMELGDQEGGVIPSGHDATQPHLPPRPGTLPADLMQFPPAEPSHPMSPAATGANSFAPPPGLPPRPSATYPYPTPQSPYSTGSHNPDAKRHDGY